VKLAFSLVIKSFKIYKIDHHEKNTLKLHSTKINLILRKAKFELSLTTFRLTRRLSTLQ
jgi:hypothetical protein